MTGGELAAGLALAAAAAACYDGAVALQAREARSLTLGPVGLGFVAGLARRPGWLAATGLAIAGWPLQVAALALAPLTVVQPALALGLPLLLWLGARWLGEPARSRDLVAAAAIGAGLALLAWAAPESERVHASSGALATVLGGLAAVAGAPWLLRRNSAGGVLTIAAGCGFAASGLTSTLLADALAGGHATAALGWAVFTAAVAGLGLGNEMAALQRAGAARVAAGAFALQTVVPVLCAPLLTGERWTSTPLHGGVILAGLALVTAGGLALGSAPGVSRLVAGAGRQPR